MRSIFLSIIILIIVNGCVEPYDLKSSDVIEKLVVDGEITDQPGPYKVKLFYSRDILSPDKELTRIESGASVWIECNTGEEEKLMEMADEPGSYVSSSILGEVGKSYRIVLNTRNGKKYQSAWEYMEPAGTLHNFYSRFEENMITPLEGEVYEYVDGFKFLVNASSNPSGSGLLRWRWKGVFKIISAPQNNTKFVGRAELPDPLPCSGYIVGSRGLTQVSECTCCICWGYDYGRDVVVSDNANALENDFKDVLVGQMLINRPRFYERYFVELEQLSISESQYNFWKLIADQQKATGNLFQSNAVRIRGNISGVDGEEVLGFFSVSSVIKVSFSLDQRDVPYPVGPIHMVPYDCRTAVIKGTTEKPDFW